VSWGGGGDGAGLRAHRVAAGLLLILSALSALDQSGSEGVAHTALVMYVSWPHGRDEWRQRGCCGGCCTACSVTITPLLPAALLAPADTCWSVELSLFEALNLQCTLSSTLHTPS